MVHKNIVISMDMKLKEKMDKYPFINWSAVARIAFRAVLRAIEKEKLTEEDIENMVVIQLLSLLGDYRRT